MFEERKGCNSVLKFKCKIVYEHKLVYVVADCLVGSGMYIRCMCMYVCMCVWLYGCMCVCVYVCMCVCVYVCMCVCVYMCMCVCVYVCMCVCVYVFLLLLIDMCRIRRATMFKCRRLPSH